MKRKKSKENGEDEEATARGAKGNGVENQYEITLARASAKLQVIKRADKQMKQREVRGAASPRREQEQKEEERRERNEWERTEKEKERGEGKSSHLGRKTNTLRRMSSRWRTREDARNF